MNGATAQRRHARRAMTRRTEDPLASDGGDVAARSMASVSDYYDHLDTLYAGGGRAHIHHGYWAEGDPPAAAAAENRLVDRLVAFGSIPRGARVLDAGCGIGGTAVHLAETLDCEVIGVTISDRQVARARSRAAGCTPSPSFELRDALDTGYPDGSFDVVLAIESLEVMPDKQRFLAETLRLLRPGGSVVIATWCLPSPPYGAEDDRHDVLRRICDAYCVGGLEPLERLLDMCRTLGFGEVTGADWTDRVRQTWQINTSEVTVDLREAIRLARQRVLDVPQFATYAALMAQAYARNAIRYGVFRATR